MATPPRLYIFYFVLYHLNTVNVVIHTTHEPRPVKLLPVHLKPFLQLAVQFV